MEKIINKDGSTTYKGVLIDKSDDQQEITFDQKKLINRGYIDTNHGGGLSPRNVIGEIEYITKKNNTVEGDLRIYPCDDIEEIENPTPSIRGIVLERDGDKVLKYEILSVSLCNKPNINKDIKSLKEQNGKDIK